MNQVTKGNFDYEPSVDEQGHYVDYLPKQINILNVIVGLIHYLLH